MLPSITISIRSLTFIHSKISSSTAPQLSLSGVNLARHKGQRHRLFGDWFAFVWQHLLKLQVPPRNSFDMLSALFPFGEFSQSGSGLLLSKMCPKTGKKGLSAPFCP